MACKQLKPDGSFVQKPDGFFDESYQLFLKHIIRLYPFLALSFSFPCPGEGGRSNQMVPLYARPAYSFLKPLGFFVWGTSCFLCYKTIWFLHDRPAGSFVTKPADSFDDSYQLVPLL